MARRILSSRSVPQPVFRPKTHWHQRHGHIIFFYFTKNGAKCEGWVSRVCLHRAFCAAVVGVEKVVSHDAKPHPRRMKKGHIISPWRMSGDFSEQTAGVPHLATVPARRNSTA